MIKARSKFALPVLAPMLALSLLSACGGSDGASSDAAPKAKSVQQLMANTVQPTAETYWDKVQFITDMEGFHEIQPETDEEWKATQDAAIAISDIATLLATPEYSDGRDEAWFDFTDGLTGVAKLAEEAAIAQDPELVFEVGGKIYNVCKGCHQTFPPEAIPDGMTEEEFFESQERAE